MKLVKQSITLLLIAGTLAGCNSQPVQPGTSTNIAEQPADGIRINSEERTFSHSHVNEQAPSSKRTFRDPITLPRKSRERQQPHFDPAHSAWFVKAIHNDGKGRGRIEKGMAVAIGLNAGECILLTNHHVAGGAATIFVTPWHNYADANLRQFAEEVWSDPYSDITAIRTDGTYCTKANLSPDYPVLGTPIFTFGQPVTDQGLMTNGIVGAYWNIEGRPLIASNMLVRHGFSGSGVFNQNNNLIGLVVGMPDGDNRLSFIIPACSLTPIIDALNEVL